MFRRILVPVDYSEHSVTSVKIAAELAKPLGATVDIVHVWDRPTYVSEGVMVRRSGEEHRSLSDLIRENAESVTRHTPRSSLLSLGSSCV